MTFTEAAIEVLRREGKPLHFKKIAEIAIRESLLDHVGKIPEEVMADQLATQCRLPPADRKVAVVQAGTFALSEWGLDEDVSFLEGMVEPPPADELLYRGNERHPTPSHEMVRASGRGEGRGRRREEGGEERRGRRYPPPAEVAYEILAGAGRGLPLTEIAAQGAERLLMPEVFVRDGAALAAALLEDNRRRESAGRKPLFAIDGEAVTLAAQPEPGERAAVPLTAARQAISAGDLRRSALLALRRRLAACDGPTVEHVSERLLEALGLRELKVAKRGRDHAVYTGRLRMGLTDVRHCVRVMRSSAEPGRRDVSDLRRDVGHYGAQIGLLLSPAEATRDARGEAGAAGQLPVVLIAGEALAEALTLHSVGCKTVVVPEVSEEFFESAAALALEEEAARRARREERDRREGGERGRIEPGAERTRQGQEPRSERGRSEPGRSEPVVGASRPAGDEREEEAEPEVPAERAPVQPGTAGAWALVPDDAPVGGQGAATAPRPGGEPPAARLLGPESEEDGDDDEEGEEGDEDDAPGSPPAAASAAGAVPAEGERPAADGRRRRRRRRRRGGRGRSREPGSGGEDAPGVQKAGPGAPPAQASAAAPGASAGAAGPGAAPPSPEPAFASRATEQAPEQLAPPPAREPASAGGVPEPASAGQEPAGGGEG